MATLGTQAERLAKLETRMVGYDGALARIETDIGEIKADLRVVRDAMLQGRGAAGARWRMTARMQAWLTLVASLLSGALASIAMKKFG